MNPLLAQFIAESRDQLEQTGTGLLAVESDPHNIDKLNEIFRAAHTIKGSSGLFEIRPVTLLVHAAEDLLDALRSKTVHFERGMIDLLLDAFDQVGQWLDELERTGTLSMELEAVAREQGAKLRAFLQDLVPEAEEEPLSAPTFEDLRWLGQFPEPERATLYQRVIANGEPLVVFRYVPDAQCFFSGEDPFHQVRQIPGLVSLGIAPIAPWPPLAELDAYHCVLRFEGLACTPLAEVAALFRYVPDQACLLATPPQVLAIPMGRRDDVGTHDDFVAEALSLVEQEDWIGLRESVAPLLASVDPESWIASALRWLLQLLEVAAPDEAALRGLLAAVPAQQGPDWLATLATAAEPVSAASAAEPASAWTAEEQAAFQQIVTIQLRILELPVEPELWTGRIEAICASLSNGLRYARRDDLLEELEEAQETALETRSAGALRGLLVRLQDDHASPAVQPEATVNTFRNEKIEEATADKVTVKTLKVDQHKVDRLMDLIGELVVAKNSLPYLAQRAERLYGSRDMAREIKEQYGVINRIAQELQGSIMQVRMMPVGHVFQRFPRLVRDLSKKLDKLIQLTIEGEDTEADKNIIETLADPLIHILRNSIDHGIEPPEERLVQGKPAEGRIRVRAYQDSDRVAIEITDDGRGVDAAAVKDKALRRGLLTPEQAETLSEHDAVQFIFAPGLSTTEQVSDVSGRGVGMDVVRTSVEKVGGTVTVHSERGRGTDIRLTLPLSMAVTHVMAVELEGKPLGVPMDLVVETVRLAPAAIYAIKHQEAFLLRDRLVPLTRLRRLLGLAESPASDGTLATLVVKVHGNHVGIVVDDFREGMEVILKPMDGILGSLHQYAGTALLGDGSVMLVINLKELL